VQLIDFFVYIGLPKFNRPMENYIITIGTYLVLMVFCKVYYKMAIKE